MEPEELTDEQLEELTQALVTLREDLQNTLRTTSERASTVDLDQAAVGRISRVDALQQQAMAQAQKHRQEQRLKTVINALKRVENGAYGECPRCGELIGYRRLRARPETPFCLECAR